MTTTPPDRRTVTVYEPTVTGIPPLRPYLRTIWARRPLIWNLARTDLKGEHYDTALGQVWILLDPLLQAAVYYLLRTVVRPIGTGTERNALVAHLIMAVFVFQYTSKALTNGSKSILSNKQLILNTSFPRAIFPIVATIKSLLGFLPTIVVYFLFHWIFDQPFGWSLMFLPLIIVLQTIFNLGIALLFAPLTVFFRDTGGFLPYFNRIWMFTSPVLFRVSEIPAHIATFLKFNPLYPMFAALEQIYAAQTPSAGYLLATAGWAVGVFLVGSIVFLLRERDFAVRF
jgi:teichoic acid transport system permease protein